MALTPLRVNEASRQSSAASTRHESRYDRWAEFPTGRTAKLRKLTHPQVA